MRHAVLSHVAEEMARSLSYARVRGSSAYITTALSYPNGSGIVLRIDEGSIGYTISDGGHSSFIAGTMNASVVFRRVASNAAARFGVKFAEGTIYIEDVSSQSLVSAAVAVANAISRAMDRTSHAVEQQRARQSKDLFDLRLQEAFGNQITFDIMARGATNREWEFDAGLFTDGKISAFFDLVSPAFFAVAASNMKLMDVRAADEEVALNIALADYDRTEPSLRAILSHAADKVIDAKGDLSAYASLDRSRFNTNSLRAH